MREHVPTSKPQNVPDRRSTHTREPRQSQVEQFDTLLASLDVELYRVGGSVRDELIGRPAKDGDYMVRGVTLVELGYKLVSLARARGGKVTQLTLRDGQRVGYRLFLKGVGTAEIVLPRKEVSTGPGHSDFQIVVDPAISLDEDAQRRDFTFNALYKYIGVDGGMFGIPFGDVVDPTGRGLYDLERRLINVTHADSFRDDPLRILRALRFVARGYELGSNTRALMEEQASAITGLTVTGHTSGTVFEEMEKILAGDHAVDALRLARDTGVLGQLFPELAPMLGFDQESKWHSDTVDEHTLKALEVAVQAGAPMRVRWSLLFHDSGKPESAWRGQDGCLHYYAQEEVWAEIGGVRSTEDHAVISRRLWLKAAERINVPKKLREEVAILIREHMLNLEGRFRPSKVRIARVRLGDSILGDLILHRACDCGGKDKVDSKSVERLAQMVDALQEARTNKVPASVGDLQISGHDVIALGGTGWKVGKALAAVLHEVVSDPDELRLSREWQLKRAEAFV